MFFFKDFCHIYILIFTHPAVTRILVNQVDVMQLSRSLAIQTDLIFVCISNDINQHIDLVKIHQSPQVDIRFWVFCLQRSERVSLSLVSCKLILLVLYFVLCKSLVLLTNLLRKGWICHHPQLCRLSFKTFVLN